MIAPLQAAIEDVRQAREIVKSVSQSIEHEWQGRAARRTREDVDRLSAYVGQIIAALEQLESELKRLAVRYAATER